LGGGEEIVGDVVGVGGDEDGAAEAGFVLGDGSAEKVGDGERPEEGKKF
jgi:hypothetical protein